MNADLHIAYVPRYSVLRRPARELHRSIKDQKDEKILDGLENMDLGDSDNIQISRQSSSTSDFTRYASTPPNSFEQRSAISQAESQCKSAFEVATTVSNERSAAVSLAMQRFSKIACKMSQFGRPESLLNFSDHRFAELDLCNSFKYIADQDERAKAWLKLTDLFPLHVTGVRSDIEHQQASNFFFNSAYVNSAEVNKRSILLLTHLISRSDLNESLLYVFAELHELENPTEQYEVALALVSRLAQAKSNDGRNAIFALTQAVLKSKMSASDLMSFTHVAAALLIYIQENERDLLFDQVEQVIKARAALNGNQA